MTPREAGRALFDAINQRDVDRASALFANEGTYRVAGQSGAADRGALHRHFAELLAGFPDLEIDVLDEVADELRYVARWRMTGTFAGPGEIDELKPTGARIEVEGCDLMLVEGGGIRSCDSYYDGATLREQLGVLPPEDSLVQRSIAKGINARWRARRKLLVENPERIADGVWLVRGGFPVRAMNVYLIEDGDGFTAFDAGIRAMAKPLAAAVNGGIERVVIGHAHADHRGGANELAIPVYCHAAEVEDLRGAGGARYYDHGRERYFGVKGINVPLSRFMVPRFMSAWDSGPVEVAGELQEGDEVAGFEVIHLPGHTPGSIALWRRKDALALTSDCFYTFGMEVPYKGEPRMPGAAFTFDAERTRESIRKLARLNPLSAWPGHADPVTGDVRAQLERAAETT